MTEPLHPSIAAHYAFGMEPDRLDGSWRPAT
jgi:hypothetical protein